ncbi:MAG: sensor histidine kinase [Cyanobacteria bacterium P01_A01_bin.40]
MNTNNNLVETNNHQGNENYGFTIANRLIKAMEEDEQITSSRTLSFGALRDSLPEICQTIVEIVTSTNPDIETTSLSLYASESNGQGTKHGYTRWTQNFDPEEIVREFFLLKKILISELKPQLLANSPEKIIDKLALIDTVINRIMENSFQSYAELKKRQLENLHQQIFLTNQELTRLIADHQESLSYLVHEIKNPLTSIIGYSDLFLRQQEKDNSITNLQHIQQVLQQGREILRLVNDTSEISSFKKGDFPLRIKQVNMCSLLENITLGLKSSIEAKNLKLITSCNPQKLLVKSDSLRIQQIITNLLINAIRYTPQGTIEVTCRKVDAKLLEIKVTDTGIGISQSEQQRIFEPYVRGQNSNIKAIKGLGLGLAIVAQLVSTLGGEIKLSSEIDVGSIFTVTIPLLSNVDAG